MRMSSDRSDPGYLAWVKSGRRARVFLGGTELSCVVTADEKKRMLVRCRTDERGRLVLSADRTEVLTETLHGDVRIEPSR